MKMTLKTGVCDAARFTRVMGLCQFVYYIACGGNIVCATPPTPFDGFC